MIKVKGLNKYFNKGKNNEIHVINDTSLELPSTGLISFLGHSGSGKTTLLNVIGGLDKASGYLEYDDITFNRYNMHKMDIFRSQHIGYVFQNYNLLLEETVYDNLKIALEIIGVTNLEEIDKRIEYTLKAVGMFKYRKKKAFALSGGQQQRVSIARALVKNSKIIIADEPTGNLDSNNTIEVMNILKKISKEALVLMVTHEQSIARFYSDYIFEIQDGKILKMEEMNGESTLKRDKGNIAYLKDMSLTEGQTPVGRIRVYQEDEQPISLDLDFIVKNGTIYLNTNQSVKLVSNSNLKIIDDHYQEIDKDEWNDFNYDTSWYRDLKENKHFLKRFFQSLKLSFLNFKNAKRRVKFLYFALVCIGFVSAISMISLINASKIDTSNMSYNKNYHTIINEEWGYNANEIVKEAYDKKAITNVLNSLSFSFEFKKRVTYNKTIEYTGNISVIPYQEEKVNLLKGTAPTKENEICISLSEAEGIVKASLNKLNNDSILGEKINVQNDQYTICGISQGDNCFGYITLNDYCRKKFDYGNSYYYEPELYESDLRYAKMEQGEYTIIYGRDIDWANEKLEVEPEVLVSKEIWNSYDNPEETVLELYETTYRIVGCYTYPFEVENMYLLSKEISEGFSVHFASYPESCKEYKVVEGKDVSNDDEVIVSVHRKNIEIGSKVNGKKVVGKFVGSTKSKGQILTTLSTAITEEFAYDYNTSIFDVVDKNLAQTTFSDAGFYMNNIYLAKIEQEKQYMKSTLLVFTIMFVVLAIISAVFIYFIMRSKMISDIYSIGVYRSLGASRLRINRKFLLDSIILTTLTILLGYIIAFIGYNFMANMINDVFQMSFLKTSNLYTFLGGLGIYIVMIFFGMLPILMLLRKTPSEICSKYDI